MIYYILAEQKKKDHANSTDDSLVIHNYTAPSDPKLKYKTEKK